MVAPTSNFATVTFGSVTDSTKRATLAVVGYAHLQAILNLAGNDGENI
jgi:hypothetical protein